MGLVLDTLKCVDPDSAGTPLDYQLRFHSPPDSASLRLRDRILEVPNTRLDSMRTRWEGQGLLALRAWRWGENKVVETACGLEHWVKVGYTWTPWFEVP